jgi:hypothetical protein
LDTFVGNLQEYTAADAATQTELKKNAWERLLSYGLLANLDAKRYDKLRTLLNENYANGTDEFPASLSLMRERMDVEVKKSKTTPKHDNLEENHWEKKKENQRGSSDKEKTISSFAQLTKGKFYCYCCGSPDHKADKCPEKETRPKEKWFKNVMESHLQSEKKNVSNKDGKKKHSNKNGDDESVTSDKTPRGWTNVQMVLNQEQIDVRKSGGVILLDTGSTMSIFHEPNWVEDIKKSSPIHMSTNAGVRSVNRKANVPGFGEVWFDDDAIANIFGFANLVDKYRVTYDSQEEDAFIVHTENGRVKFERTPEGLYAYRLTDSYKKILTKQGECNLVDTVKENRMGLTKREFQRAVKARQLFHSIGGRTVEEFITFV